MDFFKSAVASAIAKGSSFPFTFGDRVDIDQSIWTLQNGTKRDDGTKCSIFSFDINAKKSLLPIARNALRKLRTLRHPGVIKVFDTVETDAYIYIATERLVPLGWHIRRKSLTEETLKWGLFNIAKTLAFINGEASSVHGCVRSSSVFTTESGEWKLGGFEVLSSMKEDDAIIYNYGDFVPDSKRYAPPEIQKSGWQAIKSNPISAVDAYDYGVLIFEAFNGGFAGSDQLTTTKSIPPSMQQSYKRLINSNPKARLSVAAFLEHGRRSGGFFETPLVHITEGIESLGLKTESEREELLEELNSVSEDFPEDFFRVKILPELLKSVEFGGGGPQVFSAVMKIGAKLSTEDFDAQITPAVVRLFSSPDRAMRVCLLDNLPLIIEHLSQKIVNDKIFPQMITGFSDVAPVVREQTLKAVLTVVPKLSERVINGELLRHLAKTANDDQPGIRTNTTICLGKIARNLNQNTRTKVLTAAFSRSLRDPFVHARNASLMALSATVDLFNEDDCATKLLPAVCPLLVDKEKIIRDQANKTLDVFLQRIRKYSQTLPESVLPPQSSSQSSTSNAGAPRMGQNDTSWAGWAISSFTNKLGTASGQMQTKSNSATPVEENGRPASTPPSINLAGSAPASVKAPSPNTQIPSSTSSTFPGLSSSEAVASDTATPGVDFGDDWGDNFDVEPDESSGNAKPTDKDDGKEPDFDAWLNARAQSKSKAKNPLPKGLSSAKRPVKPTSKSSSFIESEKTTKRAPLVFPTSKPPRKEPKASSSKEPTVADKGEDDESWGNDWQ